MAWGGGLDRRSDRTRGVDSSCLTQPPCGAHPLPPPKPTERSSGCGRAPGSSGSACSPRSCSGRNSSPVWTTASARYSCSFSLTARTRCTVSAVHASTTSSDLEGCHVHVYTSDLIHCPHHHHSVERCLRSPLRVRPRSGPAVPPPQNAAAPSLCSVSPAPHE